MEEILAETTPLKKWMGTVALYLKLDFTDLKYIIETTGNVGLPQ